MGPMGWVCDLLPLCPGQSPVGTQQAPSNFSTPLCPFSLSLRWLPFDILHIYLWVHLLPWDGGSMRTRTLCLLLPGTHQVLNKYFLDERMNE